MWFLWIGSLNVSPGGGRPVSVSRWLSKEPGPRGSGLLAASPGWLGLRFGSGGKALTLCGVRLAGGSRAALPSWREPPQSRPRRRCVLSHEGIAAPASAGLARAGACCLLLTLSWETEAFDSKRDYF